MGKKKPFFIKEDGGKISFESVYSYSETIEKNIQFHFPDLNNQPIGLFGDKNENLIGALFGILMSGNAYLPINAQWPSDRIQFIIRKSGLQACIVLNENLASFKEMLPDLKYTVQYLNERTSMVLFEQDKIKYPPSSAYLLFTSGSTGFPKGIVHSSDSMMAFLNWATSTYKKINAKRFISIAPLNFDLSVFDVFFPLITNAQVLLPSEFALSNTRSLIELIAKNKTEVVYTTPSFLNLLLKTGKPEKHDLNHVKLILIAGEQLDYQLVHRLKEHFKKACFFNLYGPTETNVCTYYEIKLKKEAVGNVPIGKPCYRNSVSVLKSGELVYKGKLLFTASITEKGISKIKKGFMYKTGDLVIKRKDGLLEFSGRKDFLIKRNGFRIELNEIKMALQSLNELTGVEVVAIKDEVTKIICFVTVKGNSDEWQLKTLCLKKLPAYMIPDRIIIINRFPLNSNHKTDFKKLVANYL